MEGTYRMIIFTGILTWMARKSTGQVLLIGLILALVFEGLTCLFRFGLGMQSTRDTRWLSSFTFGFRIHHGYVGVLLLLIASKVKSDGLRKIFIAVGLCLAVSDLIHHFAVLWPITGSPEFHIRYPDPTV